MPSQYEQDRLEQRNNQRRRKARSQEIDSLLGKVAHALHLDRLAEKLSRKLSRNAFVPDQASEPTAHDSTGRMRWRIFWGIACLATGLDYMAAGHIGEALAQLIAPAFHPLNTNTPVAAFCIRQFAILLFVFGAVTCTLAAKFLSVCAVEWLKSLRAAAQTGQHFQFWSATAGIVAVCIAKLGYIALLGVFYLGFLFGFAREYAVLSAAAQQETLRANQPPPISITVDRTNVVHQQGDTAQNGVTTEQDAITDSSAERLAGAPRVYYAIIVLIHAALVFFPVSRFSQVYHESRRAKLTERISSARATEADTLRAIYDQIRLSPNEVRQDLILAAEPVVDKINKLYKREVIHIAGRAENSTTEVDDPGDEAAGAATSGPSDPPPQPGTPGVATAEETSENTTESDDAYSAIFGSAPQPTI